MTHFLWGSDGKFFNGPWRKPKTDSRPTSVAQWLIMKTSRYFGLSESRVPLNQNPLWLIMLFSLLNSNLDMSTLFSDRPLSASSHVLACRGMGEISPNDMNDVCPLDRRVETWSWCMTLVIITGSTLQMLYYKNVFLHVFLHGGFPLFGGTSISGW